MKVKQIWSFKAVAVNVGLTESAIRARIAWKRKKQGKQAQSNGVRHFLSIHEVNGIRIDLGLKPIE